MKNFLLLNNSLNLRAYFFGSVFKAYNFSEMFLDFFKKLFFSKILVMLAILALTFSNSYSMHNHNKQSSGKSLENADFKNVNAKNDFRDVIFKVSYDPSGVYAEYESGLKEGESVEKFFKFKNIKLANLSEKEDARHDGIFEIAFENNNLKIRNARTQLVCFSQGFRNKVLRVGITFCMDDVFVSPYENLFSLIGVLVLTENDSGKMVLSAYLPKGSERLALNQKIGSFELDQMFNLYKLCKFEDKYFMLLAYGNYYELVNFSEEKRYPKQLEQIKNVTLAVGGDNYGLLSANNNCYFFKIGEKCESKKLVFNGNILDAKYCQGLFVFEVDKGESRDLYFIDPASMFFLYGKYSNLCGNDILKKLEDGCNCKISIEKEDSFFLRKSCVYEEESADVSAPLIDSGFNSVRTNFSEVDNTGDQELYLWLKKKAKAADAGDHGLKALNRLLLYKVCTSGLKLVKDKDYDFEPKNVFIEPCGKEEKSGKKLRVVYKEKKEKVRNGRKKIEIRECNVCEGKI